MKLVVLCSSRSSRNGNSLYKLQTCMNSFAIAKVSTTLSLRRFFCAWELVQKNDNTIIAIIFLIYFFWRFFLILNFLYSSLLKASGFIDCLYTVFRFCLGADQGSFFIILIKSGIVVCVQFSN